MRVTEGMKYSQVLRNLGNITSQHAQAAEQASTGIRVGKPSDDPIAAAELARLRASSSQTSAHLSAITAVRGDAELTEATLGNATDLLTRLQELAVQAANGSMTADDRQVIGMEVSGIKDAMLQLSNARGTRGYLFSGSQVATPAFDSNGVFQGDDQQQLVPIGNSVPTAVSTSGADSFVVSGGRNVFADIDAFAAALQTNDQTGLHNALDDIDKSHAQIVNAQARSGLVLSKLDASENVLSSLDSEQQKRASAVGAADPYESYTRVTTLGQALDRAIAVSRQILDAGSQNRF